MCGLGGRFGEEKAREAVATGVTCVFNAADSVNSGVVPRDGADEDNEGIFDGIGLDDTEELGLDGVEENGLDGAEERGLDGEEGGGLDGEEGAGLDETEDPGLASAIIN
ncbi:unnamed protein product [Phytophthora lilii]|uniref:Unnamed protein product n=1 Tax=Phytophthora lilii TaxID=2077276 RepID=A0A9W7CWS1_9STRA|nr:unnamed protein product [Phytophthora lilii]